MATTFRLEEGGFVTVAVGPPLNDDQPQGAHLLRLEAGGRGAIMATAFLHPGEGRALVVELLRRLKGGDDVVHLPIFEEGMTHSLDRLVNLICGETVAPASAGEKGGEPT